MITLDRLLNVLSATLAGAWMCLLGCLATPTSASAGSTDPEVALGEVIVHQGWSATSVAIKGSWAFDDVLQVEFPLTLVLSAGTEFYLFRVGEPARSGVFPGLSDGLTIAEIASLEAAAAIEPAARFVRISPHQLMLSLPSLGGASGLTAVGYVAVPGEDPVISNSVTAPLHSRGTP